MKRALLVITLLTTVLVGVSCDSAVTSPSSRYEWEIIQSPETGRYYEIVSFLPKTTFGMMAMSEVTKAEYDAYQNKHNNK